jgi:integrase/recombinase XerD
MVARSMPPKAMAKRLVRLLRPQRPDYPCLKKVFQHTRELLQIKPRKAQKRLPELLTDEELVAFYETVWHGRHPTHMVMVKLLLFTGMRNVKLAHVQLKDVDLNPCQLRIEQGKGKKDRYVLFPKSFRGELTHYLESQKKKKGYLPL